jgi:hypothetical protein
MSYELYRISKEAVVTHSRYNDGIFLQELRKPTKNLSEYRCPG